MILKTQIFKLVFVLNYRFNMPYCAVVGCETGTGRKEVVKYQTFKLPESKGIKAQWLS